MTKDQYNSILPYKPVIDLFAKCGEYVGGCDGLFQIMHNQFGMELNTSCVSCTSAMLLTANRLLIEHEKSLPGM